jgi:hypothetical protein
MCGGSFLEGNVPGSVYQIIEATGERVSGEIVVRVTGFAPSTYRLMTLSAFSLPSFASGIAGVASGLPLFFHGGFPRGPLSEFHIAGLLLGFQRGLASGSLGSLCRGQSSSLLRFNGQSGGFSLSHTGIASRPDRVPCRAPLDSGRALGCRPGSGRPFQLGLFRIFRCAQAVGNTGVLGPLHLNLIRSG